MDYLDTRYRPRFDPFGYERAEDESMNRDIESVTANQKKEGNVSYEPIVTVSTKAVNSAVLISIADNGNGIPQTAVDKIFQPFFTTKPTGEGTGLGLSMSYDIVTKGHGGELTMKNKDGEGAEFIIYLPK